MKKMVSLLLICIIISLMIIGCSNGAKQNSRAALEREAISVYENSNGIGSAKRDGFSESLKNCSNDELRMILGH